MVDSNFVPGLGRLATDRFDFQKHIEGVDFRHTSDQINLKTLTNIDGYPVSTFDDAVNVLATIVTPPIIQNATTFVKGIVQLAGDIGGVATNVVVTGIQQRPISTLTPSDNDVLTWDALNSVWAPKPSLNIFTAGGDLSGTNFSQQVIGLTGDVSNNLRATCHTITFDSGFSPSIVQGTTSSNGSDLSITAQGSTGTNRNGGNIVLSGGLRTGSGLRGGIILKMNNSENNMVQLTEVISGNQVLSLLNPNNLSNTDMPVGTGSMVMYVRNTATPPSSGLPTNGVIVHAANGQLFVTQPDGNQFPVGSLSNPTLWGPTGAQTYTFRATTQTTSSAPATSFSFILPDHTAAYIEAIVVGKRQGSSDSMQYSMRWGFSREGAMISIGGLIDTDSRVTGISWASNPIITSSSNTIQVNTGSLSSGNAVWFTIVRLCLTQA